MNDLDEGSARPRPLDREREPRRPDRAPGSPEGEGPGPGGWTRDAEGERVGWEGVIGGSDSTDSTALRVRITEGRGGADIYVHDPPAGLRGHPAGPCLQLLAPPEARWFRLHFKRPPADAWSAYLFLNGMLEATASGPVPSEIGQGPGPGPAPALANLAAKGQRSAADNTAVALSPPVARPQSAVGTRPAPPPPLDSAASVARLSILRASPAGAEGQPSGVAQLGRATRARSAVGAVWCRILRALAAALLALTAAASSYWTGSQLRGGIPSIQAPEPRSALPAVGSAASSGVAIWQTQRPTVTPTPLATGRASAAVVTPVLAEAPPCDLSGPAVFGSGSVAGVASDPLQAVAIPAQLSRCQTLFVSSGSLWVGGTRVCGWEAGQLCVITWTVTTSDLTMQPARAGIEADAGHNWWSIAAGSPGAVATFHELEYWAPPNCGNGGCAYATWLMYLNGMALGAQELRP